MSIAANTLSFSPPIPAGRRIDKGRLIVNNIDRRVPRKARLVDGIKGTI
jgi:hypothetical protein